MFPKGMLQKIILHEMSLGDSHECLECGKKFLAHSDGCPECGKQARTKLIRDSDIMNH